MMKKQILDLTKDLISIPSTKDNPRALHQVLSVVKKELQGFKSKSFIHQNVPSILYFNTLKMPKKFKVILNAHLDVVSANDSQFRPVIKADRLYGRGALDMKAAAAVEVLIFKQLAKKVGYPLGLQLVIDEEIGGFNGTKHQIDQGVKADFVLTGEPTNLKINNRAKGIIWARVSAQGSSAHAAFPWEGENAIWKVKKFLDKLQKSYPERLKESWKTTINLARIETTNMANNKVPADCKVTIDVRYIPEDKDVIVSSLKKLMTDDVSLKFLVNESCQFTKINDPYIVLLKKSIEKITRKAGLTSVQHWGADCRHYTKQGISAITFGPTGKGMHADDEWVSIKSLEEYYKILGNWLNLVS